MRVFLCIAGLCAVILMTPHKAPAETLSALNAYECSLGSSGNDLATCPFTSGGGHVTTTAALTGNGSCVGGSYCGARSMGTAVLPIDIWTICRWVDNSGSEAYFVPFKSAREWTSFVATANAHGLPGVSLTHCARPSGPTATFAVSPPYAGCTSSQINAPNVYGRTGISLSPVPGISRNFTCHNGLTAIQSRLQWIAGDADLVSPGHISWNRNFKFSPDLTLTADGQLRSTSINQGDEVELDWTASPSSGTTCVAGGGWHGSKSAQGTYIDTPLVTTTYTLACTGSNTLTSTTSVAVVVIPPPPPPGNGACGSANGASFSSAPTSGLCSAGTASAVSGSGPWNWSCSGSNGGTAASCSTANGNTNLCGPTNGQMLGTNKPTTGLCVASATASVVSGTGPWTWTCFSGDSTSSCSAQYCDTGCVSAQTVCTPVTRTCGSANGGTFSSTPTTGLCSDNSLPYVRNDNDGHWVWSCMSFSSDCTNTQANCQAVNTEPQTCTPVTRTCGSANGGTFSSTPTTGLCSDNSLPYVRNDYDGHWVWSCMSFSSDCTNTQANCQAVNTEPPTTCTPVTRTCGAADNTASPAAPTTGLCSDNSWSSVSNDNNGHWVWSCTSIMNTQCDRTTVACSAQVTCGCGSADHGTFATAPTTGLCVDGSTPAVVATSTGWSWYCMGTSNCSATKSGI